jgi:hypothetical protein
LFYPLEASDIPFISLKGPFMTYQLHKNIALKSSANLFFGSKRGLHAHQEVAFIWGMLLRAGATPPVLSS